MSSFYWGDRILNPSRRRYHPKIIDGQRKCRFCKEFKDLELFFKDHAKCKSCFKWLKMRKIKNKD